MKKKKHRKPLKKTKNLSKHSLKQFISKPFLLGASIVFSLIIVVYATYAWNTAADVKTNKFNGTRLSVKIDEIFSPNYQWNPGMQTEKIIRVTNNGEAAAFVRLRLDEYLATFQVSTDDNHHGDPTITDGNGNLILKDTPSANPITFANFKNWTKPSVIENQTYETQYEGPKYYLGKEGFEMPNFEYPDGSTARQDSDFNYLTIDFTDRVKDNVAAATDDAPNGKKNNWFYWKGYFYFTSVLYAGETSTPLTNGVTLSADLPNELKGALYVMDVNLDGVDILDGSLEAEWNLNKTDDKPVFDVLEQHIQK